MKNRFKKILPIVVLSFALGACSPQQVIATIFPGEVSKATSVASCESRLDPTAVGGPNKNGTYDHGLFQINQFWNKPGHSDPVADYIGRNWHKRYDAVHNAIMAKKIRDAYGWYMWSCS